VNKARKKKNIGKDARPRAERDDLSEEGSNLEPTEQKEKLIKIDYAIGGQAVIEGIMMRSPNFVATSVRKKDGSIKTKEDKFQSLIRKYRLLNIPLVRGVINLVEMMVIGMGAVNFSANEFVEDEEDEKEAAEKSKFFEVFTFAFSILLSLVLAIFLFKFIPLAVAEFLRSHFSFIENHYVIFNLIDGVVRIAIFFGYLLFLSRFKDFRRVFQYHGAEHMAIFTYENELPLTTDNVRKHSPRHPRCGTSFLILVLLTSMVVYTFVPRHPEFALNLLRRLAVVPLIAGIGYEILKWSAKYRDHALVRLLVAPGIWTQHITTRQPDDDQIEVAITTLNSTLKLEQDHAKES